jgi:hypothetical protein
MVLPHAVVQVAVRPVDNFATKRSACGAWVGNVTVGSHSLRSMAHYFFGLFEEPLGRNHISPFGEGSLFRAGWFLVCNTILRPLVIGEVA